MTYNTMWYSFPQSLNTDRLKGVQSDISIIIVLRLPQWNRNSDKWIERDQENTLDNTMRHQPYTAILIFHRHRNPSCRPTPHIIISLSSSLLKARWATDSAMALGHLVPMYLLITWSPCACCDEVTLSCVLLKSSQRLMIRN